MEFNQVLKMPVVTEKSTKAQVARKYTFLVHLDANKKEIQSAIEKVRKVVGDEELATIQAASSELDEALHAVAAELYRQAGTEQPGGAQQPGASGNGSGPSSSAKAEPGAVNADFEVVDDKN